MDALNHFGEPVEAWEADMSKDPHLNGCIPAICRRGLNISNPVPSPILRIIKMQGLSMDFSNDDIRTSYRLYLVDGKRMVATVLDPCLHQWMGSGAAKKGDYVKLKEYRVEGAPKKDGLGETLFLLVKAMEVVKLEEDQADVGVRRGLDFATSV